MVGLAVNMVVWPPLRDYSAARAIDAVDDDVGGAAARHGRRALREPCTAGRTWPSWVDRTRDLDHDIDHAWALLRQARESSRLNPRRAARRVKKTDVFEAILRDNEQAVAEARSMARTLGHSIEDVIEWEPEFRGPLDRRCSRRPATRSACRTPRGSAQVRHDLTTLAEDLSTEDSRRGTGRSTAR